MLLDTANRSAKRDRFVVGLCFRSEISSSLLSGEICNIEIYSGLLERETGPSDPTAKKRLFGGGMTSSLMVKGFEKTLTN